MNRKGISPIIAVLLLVIIAVAAAVLTYLWVLGYIGTVQQQGGTQSLQERIKVEGIEVEGGSITDVYIRNIGDVNANISTIYLVEPSGSVKGVCDKIWLELAPGQLNSVAITGDCGSTSGDFSVEVGETYVVKVVTASGAEAAYSYTYRE